MAVNHQISRIKFLVKILCRDICLFLYTLSFDYAFSQALLITTDDQCSILHVFRSVIGVDPHMFCKILILIIQLAIG